MAVTLKSLRESLLSRIDETDPLEVSKVDRYMELENHYRKLNKKIKLEDDYLPITENGSQRFTKVNPGLGELRNLSKEMANVEKTIKFLPKPKDDSPAQKAVDLI